MFLVRAATILIVFMAGWLLGVWAQAIGHADSVMKALLVPDDFRTAVTHQALTTRLEGERLAKAVADLSIVAEEQRAIRRRLSPIEHDIAKLLEEYRDSLSTTTDDIVFILKKLEESEGRRNVNEAGGNQ